MASAPKVPSWLSRLGVAFLQFIAALLVTFVVYLLVGWSFAEDMGNFPLTRPILFVFIMGLTFTAGVFLVGWVAWRLRWLDSKSGIFQQLIGALVGAYLPLLLALLLVRPLVPGHPIFTFSILTCIVGFHLPGWIGKKKFE